LFYIIFYQRIIEDKIINFIDLCSVSNISVFILDQNRHGYYIHGRSPHGIADVNMKDMVMNLERESRFMSGTRGLQANSSEQLFIMKINRIFRIQYDLLCRKYYVENSIRIYSYKNYFICLGLCENKTNSR
jgi:meckelin